MNAWSGSDRLNEGDVMGPSVVGTARESAKVNTPPLKNGSDLRESGYLIAVGSRTARFRRRHVNRLRKLAIFSLFLILLIAIIILLALYLRNKYNNNSPRLCTSKECLRSAANLALSMDSTVNPCDDFHQYVCGNWASEHPRPDMYTSYDWFRDKQTKVYAVIRDMLTKNHTADPKPVKQAKDLYASCMDTDKLEKIGKKPIYDILKSLNLPLYPTHINATDDVDLSAVTFDWLDTVIKVKTQLGMDILIGFDIFTDPRNSSVYRLVMGSPETTNPFPSLYKEKPKHSRQTRQFNLPSKDKLPRTKTWEEPLILTLDDYKINKKQKKSEDDEIDHKYIYFYGELIKIFAMDSGKLNESEIDELTLDRNIISSATDFYMLSNDLYELETGNSTDTPDKDDFIIPEYSVDEIQAHTDKYVESNNGTTQLIWKKYLEGIFNVSAVTLDFQEDKILVSQLDMQYMEAIALIVSKTHPAVLELYIWIKVVEVLALHTTKELRLLYYRSYDTRHKHHADLFLPPRSMQCASTVNDMMGMAVAYAIVEPDFYNTTRPKILTMIDLIKDALATLVGKVKWMDDNTKVATYRKIISMDTFVGFPTWFKQPRILEEFYEGIEISRDTYLANLVNIVQVKATKSLNHLRQPNYNSWATDPTEVNAYHTFQENTITVPMVMLQYPFFDLGLESLNYGSLGTILGHEITHGFDNFGRQFDKNGNLIPWWSNDTIQHYVNMTQCFVDQYSSYYVSEIDTHINGTKTLGENIADNGGLREAFLAMKLHHRRYGPEPKLPGFEHVTSDQMFFLSYANLWCGVSTKDSLEADMDDEHSPQNFRSRGTLQNSEDFARTFNCRPGSPMNPIRKRCIIF
ncbi:endothelin-converting enzyme homolog [Plodia interpunctella]|uniref:endothelin-converting enzyme homolog n=1 Tax=Plodia interpunctella TaxID=58824 RepID=UPI00236878D0|nr:endothelin-converting enzyme homolog [Plodia interpunctella]